MYRAKGLAQIFCNDVCHVWLGKGHSWSYQVHVIEMSKARHRIHIFSGPFIQPLPKDLSNSSFSLTFTRAMNCFFSIFHLVGNTLKLDIVGQARHRSIVKNQKLYIQKKYHWKWANVSGQITFWWFRRWPKWTTEVSEYAWTAANVLEPYPVPLLSSHCRNPSDCF